jgi:hypothetical protein
MHIGYVTEQKNCRKTRGVCQALCHARHTPSIVSFGLSRTTACGYEPRGHGLSLTEHDTKKYEQLYVFVSIISIKCVLS